VNYPDGRFAVQFNGTALDFKGVRQDPDGAARRDRRHKRLSAVLEQIKAQQAAYPAWRQRGHVCAAAATEQPRGAGSAVEGAGATPRCCRGAGLSHRCPPPCIPLRWAMPLAKPAAIVPGQVWFGGF